MKAEDGTGSRHPSWRCGNVTPPISFDINKGAVAKSSKSEMMIERQLFFPSKTLTKSILGFRQGFCRTLIKRLFSSLLYDAFISKK